MVRRLWLLGRNGPGTLILLIALLVLSSVLAGCTGDSLEPDGENGDSLNGGQKGEGSGGSEETQDPEAAPYRFTDAVFENATHEEQGTFGPADHCYLFGCIVVDNMYTKDVSDDVPVGVPTLVTAEFHFNASVAIYNTTVRVEQGEIYWIQWDNEPGLMHVEALVIREDPAGTAEIVVSPQLGSGDQAQTDWELKVTLEARPDQIPPGATARIPVEETTTRLNFTAVDGDTEYLLWDGDDRFLGRNKTSDGALQYTIPKDATREGGFVIYTTPGSAPVRIDALGTEPSPGTLDPFFLSWIPAGDAQTVAAMDTMTWTFDVETVPIAVGIGIDFEDFVDNGNIRTQVSSPVNTVLETQTSCYLCMGYSYRAHSDRGNSAHTPGTYTVVAEANLGTDLEVQAYLVTYER